jgi:hypothetical protein
VRDTSASIRMIRVIIRKMLLSLSKKKRERERRVRLQILE